MARGTAQHLSPACAYVAERCGSALSVQQVARLNEMLSAKLGTRDERQYVEWLKTDAGLEELAELMAAVSVHKTDLFRDEVQLAAFRETVLAPLVRMNRPLYLWSAGCATGEEVATLLILLEESGAHAASTLLGTDISETALKQARALTFHPGLFKRVSESVQRRYFHRTNGGFALNPELAQRATFRRHNLMDFPYPSSPDWNGFDVIFCRNVLIYFTPLAFDRVIDGLTAQLKPGGTLVLSAAEPILRVQPGLSTLRCQQAFFYVRSAAAVDVEKSAVRGAAPTGLASGPSWLASAGAGQAPSEELSDPRAEATTLFDAVLEGGSTGDSEAKTEQGLRRCLYLDPHFAQAHYLLGMLLDQRGQKADAASEYRRALSALEEGRSRQTAFFLNDARLKTACASALARLGFR